MPSSLFRVCSTLLTLVPALAVLPGGAGGQNTPLSSSPLLLADLYRELDRGNPQLEAAEALARAAWAGVASARRPPDPEFQLGFMNYSIPSLAPMAPIGMVQVQLMQTLPLAGKMRLAGEYAALRAQAGDARSRQVRLEQRSRVAAAFFDLLAVRRQMEIAGNTLLLLQDLEEMALARYRVGEARQSDLLLATVEIGRVAVDTLRLAAQGESILARLDALLDRAPGSTRGLPEAPAYPAVVPTRGMLDSLASRGRPVIDAGRQELLAAEAGEKLAHREIVPDLQFGVQYGQRGTNMASADGEAGDPASNTMKVGREHMGSLMIGVSVPVFARSRQMQMREEARALTRVAQAELKTVLADTRGRIGEAHAELESTRRLKTLYEENILPRAEASAESAQAGYMAGVLSFAELLDARLAVNLHLKELAVLETDEGRIWAELEMLTGSDLITGQDASGHNASNSDRGGRS